MKEHTLTKGSVGKGILLFVLPIIVGSLIQQLYVTIDAVVVGQFTGKLGLAAIDSVHTLFKFPLNFMNGLASVDVKRYVRAGDGLWQSFCVYLHLFWRYLVHGTL